MAKNRLYYVTCIPLGLGHSELEEGFFSAPKKSRAEKLAKKYWGDGASSIAATRVRLKDEGFLKHLIKAAKA